MTRKVTKNGLSIEQHAALGRELAKMQDAVNAMIEIVGTNYLSNGREVKAMERIGKSIQMARVIMEESAGNNRLENYYPDDCGRSGCARWSA